MARGKSLLIIADPHQFTSGRHLVAWLGLFPRQKSSGGKERLGKISKQGDRYLRQLLVILPSLSLLERKPLRLASVALANSERISAIGPSTCANTRIAWAIMVRGKPLKAKTA